MRPTTIVEKANLNHHANELSVFSHPLLSNGMYSPFCFTIFLSEIDQVRWLANKEILDLPIKHLIVSQKIGLGEIEKLEIRPKM